MEAGTRVPSTLDVRAIDKCSPACRKPSYAHVEKIPTEVKMNLTRNELACRLLRSESAKDGTWSGVVLGRRNLQQICARQNSYCGRPSHLPGWPKASTRD